MPNFIKEWDDNMKFQCKIKSIFFIAILLQAVVSAVDKQQVQTLENSQYNYMAGCDFITEISNRAEKELSNAPQQTIAYVDTIKDISTDQPIKFYQYDGKNILINFLRTDEKTIIYEARLNYTFSYPKILKETILSKLELQTDIADAIEIGCDMEYVQLFFEHNTLSSIIYSGYVD